MLTPPTPPPKPQRQKPASGGGGGRGSSGFERSVHGRLGALYAPGDRNGNAVILRLEGRELVGAEILELLPDFHMTEITTRLFGEKAVTYDLDFPPVDAKHMAIEMAIEPMETSEDIQSQIERAEILQTKKVLLK